MANPYFRFKQFTVYHDKCAMKVTTDACLFGAWCAEKLAHTTGSRILDIGTGTGLLALMIAQQNDTLVEAVEIDSLAATQAKNNVLNTPWKDRIHIHNQDVRTFLSNPFDVIIANPPFYEQELRGPDFQKNVAHHSESLSFKDLLASVDRLLTPDGKCYLLLPYKRKIELHRLIENTFFVQDSLLVKQSVRHESFRWMVFNGRQ